MDLPCHCLAPAVPAMSKVKGSSTVRVVSRSGRGMVMPTVREKVKGPLGSQVRLVLESPEELGWAGWRE